MNHSPHHPALDAPARTILSIACQAGAGDVDGLVATLVGVVTHLPPTTWAEVHVFDRGIHWETRQRLAVHLPARFPRLSVVFVAFDSGRPVSARLFLPDLLPSLARVLWLDCDLLVDADLSPLAGRPLHGAVAAAVAEAQMTTDTPDFNAGLMILDLALMRTLGLTSAAVRLAGRQAAGAGDQPLLNELWRGRWTPLEPRWNRQIIQRPQFAIFRTATGTIWRFMGLKPWQFHRRGARGLVADYYQLLDRAGWPPSAHPQLFMASSRARDLVKGALAAWLRLRPRRPETASPSAQITGAPGIPATPLPLCVLVPLGPGPAELARLDDLMASCLAYADRPLGFVIVNDGNDAAALTRLGATHGVATVVRENPRNGEGHWWTGGMAVGELAALRWIATSLPCCGVLKLDTDALVINRFASRITEIFAVDPAIGLVGNFESPTGAPIPPGHSMTSTLYWRSKRVSHDRELKRLIFSFWGWRRRIRGLIGRARGNGYALGDWCQGGAYALSPEFLRRLAADDDFARPREFLDIDFCEDVLMALVTYSLGLRIHFTAGSARLFASKWKGLAGPPAALAAAGHGVIHSLKNDPALTEAEIRTFFSARRRALVS